MVQDDTGGAITIRIKRLRTDDLDIADRVTNCAATAVLSRPKRFKMTENQLVAPATKGQKSTGTI